MVNANDLRVIKTRSGIEQALIKLLGQKDFEHISVQNIVDEAMINRKTFYSHYEDKYQLADLLIERVLEHFQKALKIRFAAPLAENTPETLREFYRMIFQDRQLILALFKVRTDHHYLWDDLMDLLQKAYLKSMADSFNSPISLETDYLCQSYATLSLSSIKWSLEIGTQEAVEVIISAYTRGLPAMIWPPMSEPICD